MMYAVITARETWTVPRKGSAMSDETNKVQDSLTMIVSEALVTAFTMLLRVINEAPDTLPSEVVVAVVSLFCETGIKGEMTNIEEALTSSFPEVVPFIGTLDWGNQGEPGWLYNWMSLAVLESEL
jgi:hypothetical protein